MNWTNLYEARVTTAEAAVEAIQSGQRVFLTGNASVPQTTLAALVQRAADSDEVLDLRRASVRAIVRVSQASASSKLRKR